MCICIDCKWVDRCSTYHDVEENHGVDHICDSPDINALHPFIHVSVIEDQNGDHSIEWDVRSCESFYEEVGRWSKLRPGLAVPA
tara:strand:+ start:139 stop:390 length:252 start_codon:yes stop_codon:yes gene_type:complete